VTDYLSYHIYIHTALESNIISLHLTDMHLMVAKKIIYALNECSSVGLTQIGIIISRVTEFNVPPKSLLSSLYDDYKLKLT
jgi:hypothetical protein